MAAASSSKLAIGGFRAALQSSSRQSAILRTSRRSQFRNAHSLPPLPNNIELNRGLRPLYDEQILNILWEKWHGNTLERLNEVVRGTNWENASLTETVIGTAKIPQMIQAFNFASIALNYSFFLSNLKEKTVPAHVKVLTHTPAPKPPPNLLEAIEKNFNSLSAMQLTMASMADGMVGAGNIWLVQDCDGTMGIVPTYAAGTLLVQDRMQTWQGDGIESTLVTARKKSSASPVIPPSTSTLPGYSGTMNNIREFSTSSPSFAGKSSAFKNSRDNEDTLYPLLCISLYERDWILQYGVLGKEEYLSMFWECVDWRRVYEKWASYSRIS